MAREPSQKEPEEVPETSEGDPFAEIDAGHPDEISQVRPEDHPDAEEAVKKEAQHLARIGGCR
jgi:hypothetical protein